MRAWAWSGASDLVIAGESAKFVMAYTAIGVTPDGASSWFLPRLVGLRRAVELTLTNRPLSAPEALEWGLINKVVPDDEVQAEAAALATRLAAGPTRAFGGAKRLLNESLESTFETHLALEAELIARGGQTRDAVEGMTSFVEKRPPTSGRVGSERFAAERVDQSGVVERTLSDQSEGAKGSLPNVSINPVWSSEP